VHNVYSVELLVESIAMKIRTRQIFAVFIVLFANTAFASFHFWKVSEIFSDASGTVQFVELETSVGGQQFLAGQAMTISSGTTQKIFTFPSDLPGDTINKTFLIGSQGFAALNIVAPDFVFPNNFLFQTNGIVDFAGVDRISYSSLPEDGSLSINRSGTPAANSPKNFSDSTGTIKLNAATQITVNVEPGWNLLGNSDQSALNVTSVFGNAANVLSVWKWIAASKRWAYYSPSQADGGLAYAFGNGYEPLTFINAGEGFWVNASLGFSTQFPSGSAVSSSNLINLAAGWNLAAAGDNPTPGGISSILNSDRSGATRLTSLWAWDAKSQKWFFYAPELAASSTLAAYIDTHGFLDFASANLSSTAGLWVNKYVAAEAVAYIVHGGLTWMPNTALPDSTGGRTGTASWAAATMYCSNATINGETGWRLPTQSELSSLAASGLQNGKGWILADTWSSTPFGSDGHYWVVLDSGYIGNNSDADYSFVTCVR
jgi:hypothetical protein